MEQQVTKFEFSKEFLSRFKEAIELRDDNFIKESLDGIKAEDISSLLDEFDAEKSKYVLDLLENETSADILVNLDEDVREEFLEQFEPQEIAAYINHIETDDAADILNELPLQKREETIGSIENFEKSRDVQELLRYDDDCAGGLMAKELIKANVNWNVVQCIEEIRRQAEKVEKIYSVYVVDNYNKLLGRVSLKKIILANDKTKIADIYEDDVVTVDTYQSEEEVANIMQKYDLEAIPVVNVQGQLLGRITIDDVFDVVTEQAEQERQLMAGISEDVEEDDSVWMLSRARLPWLVIGLTGGMIGARFIGVFEEVLSQVTALAFFIPLIIATGGNVGIQSSALVVQSLASIEGFASTVLQKFIKMLLVAIINGVFLGGLVYVFVYLTNDARLAFVVSCALFCVVMLASILGTVIPLILDKIKLNPALASGPFITTTIDLLGLLVYFLVAHALYTL